MKESTKMKSPTDVNIALNLSPNPVIKVFMKGFTEMNVHINVNTVTRHLLDLVARKIMNVYILGKDHTNASFV